MVEIADVAVEAAAKDVDVGVVDAGMAKDAHPTGIDSPS